jgi:hypothetical protein
VRSTHPRNLEQWRFGLLAVAMALGQFRLADDYAPGWPCWAILAAAGALALLFVVSAKQWQDALALVAATAVTIPIADELIRALEIRVHALPPVSWCAAGILSLAGVPASSSQGLLHLGAHEGLISFLPSFDKLALRPAISVLICYWIALLAQRERRISRGLFLAACTGSFLIARYLVLVLFFADADKALVGSHPYRALLFTRELTIIPLLLLIAVTGSALLGGTVFARRESHQMNTAVRLAACAGFGLIAGFVLHYAPSGREKAGRILVDDRASGSWEVSARRLDSTYYGDFSTYSMASLVEWLGRRFSVHVNTAQVLDDALLSTQDVLVLKTPEKPYGADEISAVHRFVERGGGLFLISDHTNLLGMSSHLNAIAEPYGITFRYDSVSSSDGGFSRFRARPWDHPTVSRLTGFSFMTSCSLEIGLDVQAALVAGDSIRDPQDYANSSHFGMLGMDPAYESGPLVLMAAADRGRGRVVAFTDSTVFSSFDVFKNDHDQLALDVLSFLNHEAPRSGPPMACILLVLATLAAVGFVARRRMPISSRRFLVAGLAYGFAAFLAGHLNAYSFHVPAEQYRSRAVTFLWKGGFCAFPPALGSIGDLPDEAVFDTLFLTPQRFGFKTRIAYSYEEALSGTDALVVINPLETPPAWFLQDLERFVREGGHLLLVDREAHGPESSAAAYLAPLGMTLEWHEQPRRHVHVIDARPLELPSPDLTAFTRDTGRGDATYVLGADHLTRQGLGHCFRIPDARARLRLESIAKLLCERAGLDAGMRRTYEILE